MEAPDRTIGQQVVRGLVTAWRVIAVCLLGLLLTAVHDRIVGDGPSEGAILLNSALWAAVGVIGVQAVGRRVRVLPGTVQNGRSRFTPDGSAVVYIHEREDGSPILLRRPLSAWRTGAGRTDTLFAGATEAIESFGFSPDGKSAVVSVVDWLSGLSIADGVQGIVPPKRVR